MIGNGSGDVGDPSLGYRLRVRGESFATSIDAGINRNASENDQNGFEIWWTCQVEKSRKIRPSPALSLDHRSRVASLKSFGRHSRCTPSATQSLLVQRASYFFSPWMIGRVPCARADPRPKLNRCGSTQLFATSCQQHRDFETTMDGVVLQ